jgi:type II secretory pathway pseudopilin PulG
VKDRLRSEEGFGMLELLIALVMLNVGIFALVASFNAGALAMQRASQASTAATLAEKRMELFRAQLYSSIVLDTSATTTASSNSVYAADTAYSPTQITQTCTTPLPTTCKAMETVTGPDGFSYRIDVYIVEYSPPTGRVTKRVSVIVRNSAATRTLARVVSSFDEATAV